MNVSLQRSFDLRIPARRPLLPLKAAMVFLDRTEDDIDNLVREGRLSVAFDLSLEGSASLPFAGEQRPRRLLYIWRTSAVEYGAGQATEHTMTEVLEDVLPDRPYLRLTEVKNIFSCNQGHLANLIKAGLLRVDARRVVADRGPLSSPYITRASAAEFLTKRRIA